MKIEHANNAYCLRIRRYARPQPMPQPMPIVSAIQSLRSALRLNIGWMSSIAPPKALAPINTLGSPRRPVRARGKASAAKAMRCTSLSLPSGKGGGASSGHSMATVRARPTISVSGMSKYLRMLCVLDVPGGDNKCGWLDPRPPMLGGLPGGVC